MKQNGSCFFSNFDNICYSKNYLNSSIDCRPNSHRQIELLITVNKIFKRKGHKNPEKVSFWTQFQNKKTKVNKKTIILALFMKNI